MCLNYCYHIYQNLLNFTYAFKCYHQKCKLASLIAGPPCMFRRCFIFGAIQCINKGLTCKNNTIRLFPKKNLGLERKNYMGRKLVRSNKIPGAKIVRKSYYQHKKFGETGGKQTEGSGFCRALEVSLADLFPSTGEAVSTEPL